MTGSIGCQWVKSSVAVYNKTLSVSLIEPLCKLFLILKNALVSLLCLSRVLRASGHLPVYRRVFIFSYDFFLLCLNCFFQTISYVDMQYSVTHKLLNYYNSGIPQIYDCHIVRSFCNIFITHPRFISSIIGLLFLSNKALIVHFIVSGATEVITRRMCGEREGGEVKNSDKEVH